MSENIDKVIYINLDKRIDRVSEIEKEFSDMNIPCERFSALCHPYNGSIGCSLSHLAVLKLAKERNYKNILIVEDDFTFIVSKETLEKQLKFFFENNVEYDVLMMAHNLANTNKMPIDIPNNPFFQRLQYAQTASCYLVNNHYFDKLIQHSQEASNAFIETKDSRYTYDQIWRNLQENDNWLSTKEKFGRQRPGYSDNAETYQDNNDT